MTRIRAAAALAVGALFSGPMPASAAGCFSYKQACEAICTPPRIARYYSDNPDRCSASCAPRFYQCVHTGVWVHLEDEPPVREEVGPF